LDKRFRNIAEGVGIRKTVGCKNKEEWHKTGICMILYKEKWERMIRENKSKVEINLE
jgi:hypothetical protein